MVQSGGPMTTGDNVSASRSGLPPRHISHTTTYYDCAHPAARRQPSSVPSPQAFLPPIQQGALLSLGMNHAGTLHLLHRERLPPVTSSPPDPEDSAWVCRPQRAVRYDYRAKRLCEQCRRARYMQCTLEEVYPDGLGSEDLGRRVEVSGYV